MLIVLWSRTFRVKEQILWWLVCSNLFQNEWTWNWRQ